MTDIDLLAQEVHRMLLEAIEKRCAEVCKEHGCATAEESHKAGLRITTDYGMVNNVRTVGFRLTLSDKPVSGWIHAVITVVHDEGIVEIRER